MNMRPDMKGFSLVEMMIVTTVLGILAAIAVPNMVEWVASERVRGSANDLYAGLMLARSEAMKRSTQVDLTNTGGAATDWSSGWTVRIPASTVFQTRDAEAKVTITGPASGTVSFAYTGRPTSASVDAQLTVESADYSTVPKRYVCLSLSGMPQVKRCTCTTTC
jgi:type IV fimbrial biogenesis protein FimT